MSVVIKTIILSKLTPLDEAIFLMEVAINIYKCLASTHLLHCLL